MPRKMAAMHVNRTVCRGDWPRTYYSLNTPRTLCCRAAGQLGPSIPYITCRNDNRIPCLESLGLLPKDEIRQESPYSYDM